MNDVYRRQVALLIRVMPLVFKIKDFAVHGGTAINLFHRNLPRYSVDIDITYPDFVNAYPKIHQRIAGRCVDGVS